MSNGYKQLNYMGPINILIKVIIEELKKCKSEREGFSPLRLTKIPDFLPACCYIPHQAV